MVHFKSLHLNDKILNALEKKGYSSPTEIQEKAIPHLLDKKDLLGIAQTGTGKTAAFSLPILHNLCENKVRARSKEVRALILTPTRELASQVVDNIREYSQDLGLRYTTVFGGVSIHNQIKNLQKGLDIVVATPGRLLDLYKQKKIFFGQLEVLVLDEADRMLDMGFLPDVKRIIEQLPKERQTMLFSATMPKDIASLASSMLVKPVTVEIQPQESSAKKISQTVYRVAKADKSSLLNLLLKQEQIKTCVIFSKTKHGADKIVKFLEGQDIKADAIHGDKSQNVRERILRDFRRGKKNILVATDIAARGIDVPGITHVINYDMPQDAESYVHRIGRTGRAGREGFAISFCDNAEVGMLRSVERLVQDKIEIEENHPYHLKSSGSSSGGSGASKSRSNSRFSKPRRSGDSRGSSGSGRKFGDRDSASGSGRKFGDRDSASGSGRKFGDRDYAKGSGR
jgi:ATP-dependent RNA helicase RhlE